MLLQQLVEANLPVGLQENTDVSVRKAAEESISSGCCFLHAAASADLGSVQVQLVVSDPPGLAVLQPLSSFLLHVVLFQAVWLDQLLKGGHANSNNTIKVTITKY